ADATSTAAFAVLRSAASVNASPATKSAIVNPIPPSQLAATQGAPADARRKGRDTRPHGQPREQRDADRLSEKQPEGDAVRDRARERVTERRDPHAGVREGEERHDAEGNRPMKHVLEAEERRRHGGHLGPRAWSASC